MVHFHGEKQKQSFFEGWYLKHQKNGKTIGIIPAFHIDHCGKASSSIQIITDDKSYYIPFPVNRFKVHKNKFAVQIGDSSFGTKGIDINIKHKDICVVGKIYYSQFIPLNYDIMGPFTVCQQMQCNHGVVSLAHELKGSLMVNGKVMDFDGGVGYIEKDWGTSFPKKYLWTQCGWVDGGNNNIMASVAHIPFLGCSFTGCICTILYHGKQYRIATYKGVKISKLTDDLIILTQGVYRLEIRPKKDNPHKLQAPSLGDMTRTIHESVACEVGYRFFVNKKLVFDINSKEASCEFVF